MNSDIPPAPSGKTDIGHRVASGAVWTLLMRLSVRLFGLVNIAVLARILTKADFGMIALMISTAAVLTLVLESLMRIALVRLQAVRDEHYGAAFILRAAGGIIVLILLGLASNSIAQFYDQPALGLAVIAFAGVVCLEGFSSPWTIAFQRNLEFRKDFVFEMVPGITRIAATIALAIWLRDFWAVVWGMYVGAVIRVALSYYMCRGVRLRADRRAFSDIWFVAKWSLVEGGASFGEERIDRLFLGKVGTPAQVGVFSAVLDLAALPVGNLVLPLGRAILPGLQHIRQAGPEKTRQAYGLALGGMIACCIPVAAGLALVADPLIRTVFSDTWAEAAVLLEVAAGYALADGVLGSIRQVMLAEGRLRALTVLQWLRAALYVPAMIWGFYSAGIWGAAAAKSLVGLAILVPAFWYLARTTDLPWGAVIVQVLRSAFAALVMAGVLLAGMPVLQDMVIVSWAQLLVASLSGGLVYSMALWLIWRVTGRQDGIEARLGALISRKLLRKGQI